MPTQGPGVFYFWWVGSRGDEAAKESDGVDANFVSQTRHTRQAQPATSHWKMAVIRAQHDSVRQRLRMDCTFQTYRCLPTYFRQVQTYQSTYWSTCFYAVTCLVKDSTGTVHNTKDLLTGTVVHQSTKLTVTQYSGRRYAGKQRMHSSDRIQDDFAPKKEALQSGASVIGHGRLSATPL